MCPMTMTPISSPTGPIQVYHNSPFSFAATFSVRCLDLFADGTDFSWDAIQRGRNQYYQRELASQIQSKTSATLALLTDALNIHLNVGQNLTMNSSSLFMSLATVSVHSLSNRVLQQPGRGQIQIPSTLRVDSSNQTTISLRVRVNMRRLNGDDETCPSISASR